MPVYGTEKKRTAKVFNVCAAHLPVVRNSLFLILDMHVGKRETREIRHYIWLNWERRSTKI